MSLAQLFSHLTQVLDEVPLEVQGAVSVSELAEALAAANATLCVGFRPPGAPFPPEAAAACIAPSAQGLALYAWLEYGDPAPSASPAALSTEPVFELKEVAEHPLRRAA